MPLSFDTEMLRIGELLADATIFVMPTFQRPFCWDDDTAAQLYDDISSAMVRGEPDRPGRKNRQEYFLGPIIVTRGRTPDVFEVVDGQQRLVTLTILLALLRDSLPAENERKDELQRMIVRPEHRLRRLPETPRVSLRDSDQHPFAAWVQTPGGTANIPDDDQSESCKRILEAIARLKSDIDRPQLSYIEKLASFILNNCYVIQITARHLDDGYVLFRSINSRGQPLNELDLAKAELLGAPSPSPQINMNQLAADWNAAERTLGTEEFQEYMHSVLALIATRPQGRTLRDLMQEVLRDSVKANNFRILLSSVLRHSAKLDDGMLEFGADSEKIHRIVECLRQGPISEWRSVALPWLASNPTAYHTLQFLTALDALCLGLCILSKSQTEIMRRLKLVAIEVVDQRERILNGLVALRFSQREQSQIKAVLMNPIGVKKRFLKPFLLRLNAQMLDPEIPIYFPSRVTIEHVLPRNPATDGPWLKKYPDPTTRKFCTELLGNYALLTRSINSGAKNKDFGEKRRIMFAKTNCQAFPLTSELTNYDDWLEPELMRRHHKLVGLACEMLGLSPAMAWPSAAE